jgi:hypothetical protein
MIRNANRFGHHDAFGRFLFKKKTILGMFDNISFKKNLIFRNIELQKCGEPFSERLDWIM